MNEPDRNLDKLTDAIVDSYESDSPTQRIGQMFLPSRSTIVEIIDEVRQLLFPGYFGHKELTAENVKYHVGNLLVRLGADLADQITHCLCSEPQDDECCSEDCCRAEAENRAREFLARIPMIRRMLALDAQAAYDGDPAAKNIAEIIYCYPGYYAMTVHRIAHELWKLGILLMARIMGEHAHSVTGTDIHPGATIGERFFIDHATGVVIGETTEIGRNVKMYQGVTLGALSFPKDERGRLIKGLRRHPKIEDDVTIYANATILGGDTVIGKGVIVSGNTFVTESITADSLVAQDKPKLRVRDRTSRRLRQEAK